MTAIVMVLGASGLKTAQKIVCHLPDAKIHGLRRRVMQDEADVLFDDAVGHIRQCFSEARPVIGVCAAGILVRAIAPLLGDKHREPPVIAVAPDGRSVVPLVGGHHGGNELARQLAKALDGHPAITTAGDVKFGVALDEPPAGWTLANPEDVKGVMADLMAGAPVAIDADLTWLSELPCPRDDVAAHRLTAALIVQKPQEGELVYHPRRAVIGVGSDRGCPPDELIELANATLVQSGLARQAVACVVSIDRKADEAAVHAVAAHFDVPVRFLSATFIGAIADKIPNPSDIVLREVGVPGVAEGAALAASGADQLAVEKQKTARGTCAIAISDYIIDPDMIGRARGSVFVVGVGPGTSAWRSQECVDLLRSATDWIGYGLYLDLVRDLRHGQKEHRFALGEEEERVRHALELAGCGRDVALICSGDAGIYAMAALLCEVMALDPATNRLSDAAHRVAITVVPGISAFQAAAARAGAPIGHDFCCISLSDLLTPWAVIEQRVRAAAEGDFVVAFYNPRSMRRVDQLDRAIAILRQHRPADTPVILASNLGRPTESLKITPLDNFETAQVDMLSIVLVGASTTELFTAGDGRPLVFTPRGYATKRKNPSS